MIESDKANELREEQRLLLRELRRNHEITLSELAKVAKVSQPMLSQFERGDRNLSADAWIRTVEAIAKLLTKRRVKRAPRLGNLQAALLLDPGAQLAAERERREQELERSLHQLARLGVAITNPQKGIQEGWLRTTVSSVYRPKNSQTYWIRFSVNGRAYPEENANTESKEEARNFLNKRTEEKLREQETERKRQLAALEKLQSRVDDPIISELIESFRREIAEKDKQLEEMNRALVKNGRTATN